MGDIFVGFIIQGRIVQKMQRILGSHSGLRRTMLKQTMKMEVAALQGSVS